MIFNYPLKCDYNMSLKGSLKKKIHKNFKTNKKITPRIKH